MGEIHLVTPVTLRPATLQGHRAPVWDRLGHFHSQNSLPSGPWTSDWQTSWLHGAAQGEAGDHH